jgi:hypothetical protein
VVDVSDATDLATAVAAAGDGYCDLLFNTHVCGWDGGDCCEDTCVSGTYGDGRSRVLDVLPAAQQHGNRLRRRHQFGTSTSISTSSTSSRDVGGFGGVAVVECPIGIGPEGVFDAATVAAEVAELFATDDLSPDVASAAFLAGLDVYTASAAALVLGSGSTTLNVGELDHAPPSVLALP